MKIEQYIKLHKPSTSILMLRIDQIISFEEYEDDFSSIRTLSGREYQVEESVEEIDNLISSLIESIITKAINMDVQEAK